MRRRAVAGWRGVAAVPSSRRSSWARVDFARSCGESNGGCAGIEVGCSAPWETTVLGWRRLPTTPNAARRVRTNGMFDEPPVRWMVTGSSTRRMVSAWKSTLSVRRTTRSMSVLINCSNSARVSGSTSVPAEPAAVIAVEGAVDSACLASRMRSESTSRAAAFVVSDNSAASWGFITASCRCTQARIRASRSWPPRPSSPSATITVKLPSDCLSSTATPQEPAPKSTTARRAPTGRSAPVAL